MFICLPFLVRALYYTQCLQVSKYVYTEARNSSHKPSVFISVITMIVIGVQIMFNWDVGRGRFFFLLK